METSDHELLRIFVNDRAEAAFRQMVNRHLNLVFATARRIVGDPQLAEEVAQGVFVLLARKAGELQKDQPLAAWLYHTTRYQSLNASRSEGRRRQREQTALAMQTTDSAPEPELITEELEGAMDELPPEDRDALVLRFLDNRQLRDVGGIAVDHTYQPSGHRCSGCVGSSDFRHRTFATRCRFNRRNHHCQHHRNHDHFV